MFCILWLTLTWSLVAARCLPVPPSSSSSAAAAAVAVASTVASAAPDATSSPIVASEADRLAVMRPLRVVSDDILRQFNLSKDSLAEAQSQLKHRQTSQTSANWPAARSAHHGHHHQPRAPLNATMMAVMSQQRMSRERAVNSRKQEIYNQVISFVQMNGRPASSINSTLMQQGEQVAEMLTNSGAIGAKIGRLRYLQPSCDVPKNSDDDLWTAPGSMHLYFNMSGIQAREGYQLHVANAKLRLMKYAEGEALTTDDCEESSAKDTPPVQTLNERPGTAAFFFPGSSDEDKIRVSVHNFTRPLKRHRAHKKKLLDSQMALTKESNFMELDVKLAVRWWLAPNGRNFGLVVEVEDTEGQRKSATSFFRPRNCSAALSDDADRSEDEGDHLNVVSPVLELTVLEIPEGRRLDLSSSAATSTPSSGEKRKRLPQTEEEATDEEPAPLVEDEEAEKPVHRRHQHHQHRSESQHQFEEQADEANRIQYPLFPFSHVKSSGGHHGKHKNNGRPTSTPAPFIRSLPAIPTLATLEDHDLMENTEQEEEDDKETQAVRPHQPEVMSSNHLSPQDIFVQKMLHSRGSHFGHFAPFQPQGHHPRKDSRRTAS